jgi:hypothetical protein
MDTKLNNGLENFQSITLDEMDSVKLMNRTDTKFFFRVEMLGEILERASKSYRVLQISDHRQFNYFTTYFDTPDLMFYNDHHNGKLNRFKIRQRRYDVTGKEFFEIKFKNNKGMTLKSRISNDVKDYLNIYTDDFLKRKSPYSNSQLKESIANEFVRITLVNHQLTERATLDYCIGFSNHTSSKSFPDLGIVEVKQDFHSKRPILLQIMKELYLRPEGISKYCLGIASLYNGVKINLIKQQLYKIYNL